MYPISNELKAAGLKFRADFRSQPLWSQQGGSISGDPTFSDAGVVLDSNDCVHITNGSPTLAGDYQTSGVTFVFDVDPDFASNDGTHRNFFEVRGIDGRVTFPYFYTDNSFRMYVSNTVVVGGVSYATWSPFWNESSKNTFVISVKSGDTSVWLNGNLIVDSDATTFSNQDVEQFYIGARTTPGNYAPGTYSRFEIYHWACDSVDEPHLRNGTLIQAIDTRESIITVPMEIDYDNGSGVQVTPTLGQLAGTALMGTDGTTSSEFPTKDTTKKRGYTFDGGDSITIPDNDLLSPAVLSVAVVCRLPSVATHAILAKSQTTTSGEFWMSVANVAGNLRIYFGIADEANTAMISRWGVYAPALSSYTSIIGTYDGGSVKEGIRVYVNGIRADTNADTVGVFVSKVNTTEDFVIGDGPQAKFNGFIAVPRVYDFEISPMQAKALHSIMMSEVIR